MLQCKDIFDFLSENGISFYCGVPDSVLKHFCAYIIEHVNKGLHVIAANEGGAIALAAGYFLATKKVACVYMQNAGLGNAVNPLTSLINKEVYGIPMILLIGWRGEPGKPDEPQHIKEGESLLPLLNVLGIPYAVLPETMKEAKKILARAAYTAKKRNAPYALIVRRGTFEEYHHKMTSIVSSELSREEAINTVLDCINKNDVVIATTGKASRELFELRKKRAETHKQDFLNVGAMGHASMIALGAALAKPKRAVWCLDGDGALFMHMGALAIIGVHGQRSKLRHIVLNNGAHDSVGGQLTAGFFVDMPGLARASGYRYAACPATKAGMVKEIRHLARIHGPAFLEVRIACGARADLGRPPRSLTYLKNKFIEFVGKERRV